MKNNINKGIIFLIIFTLLILTACSVSTTGSNKDTVELKLAHFFPGTHPAETEWVAGWAEAVKEATNGKVVITSYYGETLLKATDVYNGVIEGVADVGLSCFAYNSGRFPVLEAFEQPGVIYKNSKVASMVAWEGIKMLNPEEVQDTKLLMVIATGPGDLFTREPVRNLDDLEGLQIRATGLSADTLALLGANPVGMPQSEAYEALSKGMVSGNLSPVEVLKAWRHAEVTKYITQTPFLYNTLFYLTINLDIWDSFSVDIQNAIIDATEKFHEETAIGLWDRQNEAALDWAINEEGMEIINLTEKEATRWMEAIIPMHDKYIKDNGDKAREALELVIELSEKYNKEY